MSLFAQARSIGLGCGKVYIESEERFVQALNIDGWAWEFCMMVLRYVKRCSCAGRWRNWSETDEH